MGRTGGAAAGDGKRAGARPEAGRAAAGDGKRAGARPEAGVDGPGCPTVEMTVRGGTPLYPGKRIRMRGQRRQVAL